MESRRGKLVALSAAAYDRNPHAVSLTPRNPSRPSADSTATLPTTNETARQSSMEDVVEVTNSYTQTFVDVADALSENSTSPAFSNIAHDMTASSTASTSGPKSTVFLGESNSITTLSNSNGLVRSDKRELQYSIPDAVSAKTVTTPLETQRNAAKLDTLSKLGAFSFPTEECCDTLFRAYFAWFHPCFPIIRRVGFYESYISKTTSPLLLQSVLFVGASYCDEKTLHDIGLADRHDARSTFYNHAKDIYDADYETDKIIVSQALFLMSFWRAGPLLEKDTRHWLGAAISLAQTKGMHRSSSTTSLSDVKLRKRIWWSLYVRDRQCSAALGLPIRIRDEDCDIEILEASDFEDDETACHADVLGSQTHEHVSYAIQMAKLAQLLGKIIIREFAPSSNRSVEFERSKLRHELVKWEEALSPAMRVNATAKSFWAAMLHLAYNNLYILLGRVAYIGSSDDNGQNGGQIALEAACRNTRILEDLLEQELIRYGNVHIITSLFNSLCIHTVHLRRSHSSTIKKLAEYRAQLCLLGLRELQSTWDVTNWVLQLYFEFLDQSIIKRLQLVDNDEVSAGSGENAVASQQYPTNVQNADAGPIGISSSRPIEQMSNSEVNSDRQTMQWRHLVDNLDFASYLFSSREAEDFSMFQLQPDLFAGDTFGGGLDHYYNSMIPREESSANH
ncbi:hypothetical protein BP6252_11894 [Coleophoma cylindrospora]|uniref:Xylanolytic transcriptional activator regulatory domain-containing protein n=1 Tax=Coleophoma cylindrospora TaxID=1849047 RepID=A0A3D8QL74_9HELO|nr:hypothetical protein BP6252_11894 [Coleophoma cylindrospora]